MHLKNKLPQVLNDRPEDALWDLLDQMPKAALFDVVVDLVSLRHTEGCDDGLADTEWLVAEIRKLAAARGWKIRK